MDQEKNPTASFFQELGEFMRPSAGKYLCSILISMLSVAAEIGAYAMVGKIAALLFTGGGTERDIFVLAGIAAACKVTHAVLMNLSTWISHQAAYVTLRDIRTALTDKLVRLPVGYFEEHGSGRLKTVLVDRIEGMEKILAHMLPEMTANLLMPLACMVWMLLIDWRLSLIALVWIILGFSVTFGMMKGYEGKLAGQIRAAKAMNQAVVEYVSGIEVIKNFGRTGACYETYQDAVCGHATYNVNWQKESQKYSSLGMAIAPFSVFPILVGGLLFYGRGTLDGGTLILMVLLSFGIFTPLMNAMNYFDQLASMGTSAREIRQILDAPELHRGAKPRADSLDIDMEDVGFSYGDKEQAVLRDISIRIPQGSMLALVGPSGSGKSTIAKLLAGFWDTDSGTIRIGGTPLTEYSQEALNQMIAFVDQDTFLYDCSILDNIRMGNPESTQQEAMEAARAAGCDAFISALPDGYHTRVGEAGDRLSGGEKQRIAIVRAMMKKTPILILDEATASTDPENEAAIQKALSAAARGKTLIVIAHRLHTVVHADQIVYIQNGRILAQGTHEELLKDCLEYRAMWELGEVQKDA